MATTCDEVELRQAIDQIWEIARRVGLDPFPVNFELVPADIMHEFGAYGIPGRFSHWTHGRAFQHLKTMHEYGLSRIYELVINADPSYAFLLDCNDTLQNKVVAAHVLGHVDFFKHNAYFASTNRGMVESVARNAERIRRFEFEHGHGTVERFLDAVLSIQEHLDPNPRIKRSRSEKEQSEPTRSHPRSDFDDLLNLGEPEPERPKPSTKVPAQPEKDVLLFLAEHGPELEDWQRETIHLVRSEQGYFVPQMRTKIMNEGWATFWHAKIVRELELSHDEYVQFARMHANVIQPSQRGMNPYLLGFKIFEQLERLQGQPMQDASDGPAGCSIWPDIFSVRELDCDVSFLRNYMTRELIEEMDLFLYEQRDGQWVIVEKDWRKVRDAIVQSMTNFGVPYIVVEDGDYQRRRELLLRHQFDGQPLDLQYAEKTMDMLYRIWGRPVHLETVLEEVPTLLSFDEQAGFTRRPV
jgi:stage V sporulation protein R